MADYQEKMKNAKLQEITKTFTAFLNATHSSEILIIILKAHLYFERELTLALSESLVDDKYLEKLNFAHKLDLAHAIGIIGDVYNILNKVNKIRNAYAHDIEYSFGKKELEDLISILPKDEKEEYEKELAEMRAMLYDGSLPEMNFQLQCLLAHIWFTLIANRELATESIELRLRGKEIDTIVKYGVEQN